MARRVILNSPMVSPHGRHLFWTSCRALNDSPSKARMDRQALDRRIHGPGNGLGDIYEIDMSAIDAILAEARTSAVHPDR